MISRSLAPGDVELGTDITYTCTSSGGFPEPTIKLYVGSSEIGSEAGPTLLQVVTTDTSMHDVVVKCEAFNDYGTVNATESLSLFSKKPTHINDLNGRPFHKSLKEMEVGQTTYLLHAL